MKRCTKCGVEKPTSDFHKKKSSRDGVSSHCKICRRKHYLNNSDRFEYCKEYRKKNREKIRESNRKHRESNSEKLNAEKRVWRAYNQEKWRAHNKVEWAVTTGKLTRQPCEVCGETVVDAHHEDYSRPLDVRWLCRLHHKRLHAELEREQDEALH